MMRNMFLGLMPFIILAIVGFATAVLYEWGKEMGDDDEET